MALAMHTADLMTRTQFEAEYRARGFRWHRSDYVVISPDSATVLLAVLDERLATVSVGAYDTEHVVALVSARDELEAARQRATENC